MTVSVDVKYKAGHSYTKTFGKAEEFCPHCGKQEVWTETSGEDYYQGANFLCVACRHVFTMPSLRDVAEEPEWQQVRQAIKDSA